MLDSHSFLAGRSTTSPTLPEYRSEVFRFSSVADKISYFRSGVRQIWLYCVWRKKPPDKPQLNHMLDIHPPSKT